MASYLSEKRNMQDVSLSFTMSCRVIKRHPPEHCSGGCPARLGQHNATEQLIAAMSVASMIIILRTSITRSRFSFVISRLLHAYRADDGCSDGNQHFHDDSPQVVVLFTHVVQFMLCLIYVSGYTFSSVSGSFSMSYGKASCTFAP